MKELEPKFIKQLIIYSLLTGASCAVLSLIPWFAPFFSLLFIPFMGCVIPIALLIEKDGFTCEKFPTYGALGIISGFFVCTGYYFVLIPCASIIHIINNNYYDYGARHLNLFVAVLLFVTLSFFHMFTNCLIGLATGKSYGYIKGKIKWKKQ